MQDQILREKVSHAIDLLIKEYKQSKSRRKELAEERKTMLHQLHGFINGGVSEENMSMIKECVLKCIQKKPGVSNAEIAQTLDIESSDNNGDNKGWFAWNITKALEKDQKIVRGEKCQRFPRKGWWVKSVVFAGDEMREQILQEKVDQATDLLDAIDLLIKEYKQSKRKGLTKERKTMLPRSSNLINGGASEKNMRMIKERVLICIQENPGISNTNIARKLDIESCDNSGNHKGWFVWKITKALEEDEKIVRGEDCVPLRFPGKGWWVNN